MTSPTPLVLVTVGSDHHPFDRLVGWVDEWYSAQPPGSVRCVIQYGTSAPPRGADGAAVMPHDELCALMHEASAIVTQGGPMSAMEARQAGRVPIVVPRQAALGEHVDDHQVAFCRRLAADGLIRSPRSRAELVALIDAACKHPETFVAELDAQAAERVATTSARIGDLVDQLVAGTRKGPRVLLIAGTGRSGSTLFERALGDVPGVAAVGESVHMWERGVRDDELCGCGEPFSSCPFWTQVGERAFGGWRALPAAELVALRHRVVRTRNLPRMFGPSRDVGWRLERDRLARLTGAMYRAVADMTGARVIVDSSKMPAYAGLLRHAGVDLQCVYVVRDPRGVAYSWGRTVTRPEVVDGSQTMPRYGAAESAAWWSTFDAAFALMSRLGIATTTVRYEDFVAEPRSTVARTLAFAGLQVADEDLDHVASGHIRLGPGHLVAGNPMRFRIGEIELAADDAWRMDMSARDQRVVTALTVGLRQRHGYR